MSAETLVSTNDFEDGDEREALFRDIATAGPNMLWVCDPDGRCTWCNPLWLGFSGRSLAQEQQHQWTEALHPDDATAILAVYQRALAQRRSFESQCRLLRQDGKPRWVLAQGTPRWRQPDEFGGYIVSSIDITEMELSHRAERDTAKRLGELAAIVESSEDVILSKDLNGVITSWNAAATKLFGYTADEMIGRSILTLIPEHLHSDEPTILGNIRAGRRIEHFETVRRTKSGELIDVSLTVSPIKDSDGQVIGASKILRDISARKRIEQSLLQAEKIAATGRMAATIAHEINNPLEAVMNLLYLARLEAIKPEVRSYLETAENELNRVSHIAKQTLGYYREHASASSASLAELARQAISIYAPRCTAAKIEIRQNIHSSRNVTMRRGEMMQVISNLVTNSIYAMAGGGTLTITVQDVEEPQGVTLTVEDTGSGINEHDLPRVFDAFFTTRSTVGTGIGLFVARQFIQGHGGTIHVESNTSEAAHGTCVRIFLPAHTAYEGGDSAPDPLS